jgi:hypothetical protein
MRLVGSCAWVLLMQLVQGIGHCGRKARLPGKMAQATLAHVSRDRGRLMRDSGVGHGVNHLRLTPSHRSSTIPQVVSRNTPPRSLTDSLAVLWRKHDPALDLLVGPRFDPILTNCEARLCDH